jgi:hypothetical protein
MEAASAGKLISPAGARFEPQLAREPARRGTVPRLSEEQVAQFVDEQNAGAAINNVAKDFKLGGGDAGGVAVHPRFPVVCASERAAGGFSVFEQRG